MNLGIGFPESISKTPRRQKLFSKTKGIHRPMGRWFSWLLLFTFFGMLLFQAIRLQLIQGPYYRVLSEQNRIKTKILHAPRGTIYDRSGEPLVLNVPGFRERIANCSKECIRIVTREEYLLRKSRGENLDNLEIDSLRQYSNPKALAHVLGFVSQINEKELSDANMQAKGYRGGDQIGRGGIEEQYEEVLRGKEGQQLIETDAKGNEIRILGKTDPNAGHDLILALDNKLSKVANAAMVGKTGAVVVSNPKTGEILTLISSPSFDPNLFTIGARETDEDSAKEGETIYKTAQEILGDNTNKPLFNRAISGTYPPGSAFKIITAAAGLESRAIDINTRIEDTGVISVGAFSFSNWYFTQYGKTEGPIDIVKAIQRSNDIFFYKVAEFTGIERLHDMGLSFGLSKKLGIDLPNEAIGLLPSDRWKREIVGEPWYIGDTYHIGIGQGYLLVTPLQINGWTNVIANNGTLCQPVVVQSIKCKVKNEKFLKQETVDLIKEGMKEACDTGGTGWPLFKFKIQSAKLADKIDDRNFFLPEEATVSGEANGWVHIPVACKTGTAEFGDPKNRTHALFTSFAPVEDPQISVTVLVEGGGEGSNVAAPIAKKIYEEWFGR